MKVKNIISHVAEIDIVYSPKIKKADRVKVSQPYQILNYVRPFFASHIEHHEAMRVVLLSRANDILGVYTLSTGGTAGTVCDMKMLMQAAILASASGIILVHNHPSGNLTASNADIQLTKKVAEAAKLFDMELLDHLILTADSYTSFKTEGLI
jgi:DNA repair protein RadC